MVEYSICMYICTHINIIFSLWNTMYSTSDYQFMQTTVKQKITNLK